ncbi:hypothetical protein I6B53_04800 [Schaalia sp. 19OD2882]|uniref:hypothetical protein n=1 Tax=Schaalia sp. 19OD2882 TaxID=2794089 RepID=UPI001C1EA49E|nr:hypothetical protein [Schaalia sp. 19OD2882]QWW20403.1 hypothetical protein I6B53_04800 [Schaalia sp. 19OD2882]
MPTPKTTPAHATAWAVLATVCLGLAACSVGTAGKVDTGSSGAGNAGGSGQSEAMEQSATNPPAPPSPSEGSPRPHSPESGAMRTGNGPAPGGSSDPVVADAPPSQAHPGAGGPVPTGARPVTTVLTGAYDSTIFATEDGGIGCDIRHNIIGCHVNSYRTTMPYGRDDKGSENPRWAIWWQDKAGVPELGIQSDMPTWQLALSGKEAELPRPQVVPVGEVVAHEGFVCANDPAGMTCWVADSGHGAFMNDKETIFF